MALVNPSLFAALGKGFLADVYAVDGNHLRWMFDPRLGFPRFAFCVDQRPSVLGGRQVPDGGSHFVDLRLPAGSAASNTIRFTAGGVEVLRAPQSMRRTVSGVELAGPPLTIRFAETDGHACYVRLRFTLNARVAAVGADAVYLNRGHVEVVDRAGRRFGRRIPPVGGVVAGRLTVAADRIVDLLDHPIVAGANQSITDPQIVALHRRLISIDPGRFRRVSPDWLAELVAALGEVNVRPDQIGPDLAVPIPVTLEVAAARIDELRISGSSAVLHDMLWVRSEDLAKDRGWKPVGCVPAATDEPDYVDRNRELFAGQQASQIAKDRVIGGGPVGAEPLDDPLVPPSRPATDGEKARRYLDPWQQRLEPWLADVLGKSLGGALHQSEVTITEELDDAGQRRGEGIPQRFRSRPQTVTMRPYPTILGAAMSGFPTARLLGLAMVHDDPGDQTLDYRIRGRWLVEDLQAWVAAESRQLDRLIGELGDASPQVASRLQTEILASKFKLLETASFVGGLTADATEGVVEMVALVIGVGLANRPLFTAPATMSVEADGLGLPPIHSHQATAAVQWALRQRARVIDDTLVPTGACVARAPGGTTGVFQSVRNPTDPSDPGALPVAILPAGPADSPGLAGSATFIDRYVDDGVDLRYGVSECDPFGRWSSFRETAFRWDDTTPPASPVQVEARLDESGSPQRQVLTTTFVWPLAAGDPAGMTFSLHLRRTPPPSAAPGARSNWGLFERTPGSAAAPLDFSGSTTGATTHDGMAISISFVDEDRPTLSGTASYRVYSVAADGVVIPYSELDRARGWVAVGAHNSKGIASESLGGPGLAENFRIVPPPSTVFPPEPLLATYPDADRLSSFTMSWTAGPQIRSTVYRAGERDLVAMAAQRGIQTDWNEADPPAQRAAALRTVASELRDAFKPVSGLLPTGTSSYSDRLPGALKTLSLYTVVGQSPALVPGPWPSGPSGFVAVAVPKIPEPARPVVVSAGFVLDGGGAIELSIAEPGRGSAPVGSYELYRVFEEHQDRAGDFRLMRPSARVAVADSSYVDRPSGPPRIATVRDDDALLPWKAYLYRVVARGAIPGRETRSEASPPIRVVTLAAAPPGAPEVISATATAGILVIEWTAAAPSNPSGPFRFTVFDASGPITLAIAEADDSGLRDALDPDRFRLVIPTGLPSATVPELVTVRITDPIGRATTSEIHLVT